MNVIAKQGTLPSRIAVIACAGGSEHAVSLKSAENVCAALRASFAAVETFAFNVNLQANLTAWQPDVAFPVAHGSGETGELQRLLQSLGLAYVGSDESCSALCWNKVDANQALEGSLACSVDWPMGSGRCAVPPFAVARRGDDIRRTARDLSEAQAGSGLLVVKPAREGSSVGISFCISPHNKLLSPDEVLLTINGSIFEYRLDRIARCVEQAFAYDDLVLVQVAVSGVEITVAVLEDPEPVALPVVEIATPAGAWYDYEHKYSPGGSEHIIPARLPTSWLDFAQAAALTVHRALGCRDYSRVDFIVEKAAAEQALPHVWFLECNTLPGFTETSLLPDAAKSAGYSMPDLVQRLVLRAWQRRFKF